MTSARQATGSMPARSIAALAILLLAGVSACAERAADGPHASSPEARLREALEAPPGVERVDGLVAALRDLDSETAHQLAETMADWPDTIPAYELRLVHIAWARVDPGAALDYLLSLDREAVHRTDVGAATVRTIAELEPARARSWVSSLPEQEPEAFRIEMTIALVEGWPAAREGFEGVADLIQGMPIGFERERAMRALIAGLVDAGQADEAMRWADSIPLDAPTQFRPMAFRKIAVIAGRAQPDRVARWLDGHRTERAGQAGLRVLARTWAEADPEATLEWALEQPDDRGRFLAIKFGYQTYFDQDREGATAWLERQSPSPALDPARLAFALRAVFDAPEAAAERALAIQDADTREDILRKVIRQWLSQEPDGARAWMAASEHPESYWTALLRPQRSSPSATRSPTRPPALEDADSTRAPSEDARS